MRPSPRVRCGGCSYEWFGPTVAHGLRLVGSCPRCDGALEFLVDDEPEPEPADDAGDERLRALAPAAVLGLPTSWQQ